MLLTELILPASAIRFFCNLTVAKQNVSHKVSYFFHTATENFKRLWNVWKHYVSVEKWKIGMLPQDFWSYKFCTYYFSMEVVIIF